MILLNKGVKNKRNNLYLKKMKQFIISILTVVTLFGCSSNSDSSNEGIFTNFGEFISTVNTYSFVEPLNSSEIRQSFTLWKDANNSLQFSLNYLNLQTNSTEVYTINNLDTATAPFAQGSFLYNNTVFNFTSGSIEVTKTGVDQYDVTFTTIVANDPFDLNNSININGNFSGTITEF